MTMRSLFRRLIKIIHPEAIPGFVSNVYNKLSMTTVFQKHYELVAQDVQNYCQSGKILDVGTGPGWLLVELHKNNPNFKITGVDISEGMIDRARLNLEKEGLLNAIDLRVAIAKKLPFEDNSFDVVVSTGSMHHWKDTTNSLNEIYRVLKPGGYALIYDLITDIPKPVLRQAIKDFGRLSMILMQIHDFEEPFYSVANLEELAPETKFKQGSTKFVGVLCCLILKK
jgi:ubiquinone/menaquinone biosynthesis C-methylase UbiE